MTVAAGIVLISAVFVLVAWPFLRPPAEEAAPPSSPEALDHWVRHKAEAYGAIKDAEFDYQMGKMSEADFQFIRDKYAARALEAIAALEQARVPVRENVPRVPHTVRFLFCPECGNKLPPRAKFCPGCGRALLADDAA